MLSSYDLTNFSERLKSIRKSLGFSQAEVSENTGINSDTLRRLENGLSLPRFDTLEVLSQFYKVNLMIILDSYKISTQLSYFYDLIDYHMVNDDAVAIRETIVSFEAYCNSNVHQLVDIRDIEQLKLFFKGMELSYKNNDKAYKNAIDLLIKALSINIPVFKLENYQSYKYNFLELRILFTLASIEGLLRNCQLSNEIILFTFNFLDNSKYAKYYEKLLIVKSYSIISYNFHRIDNHSLALSYSEKGISFCIDHSIMTYLPLLLSRKGIAMYYLKIPEFDKYFKQSIALLRIQNKDALAGSYETILKKYLSDENVDLNELLA